ncbi:hypothetical protein M5K25_005858 [Dendrobium thyrsiflorum]|uniref:Uncharacterized protein n=1 Tax=Dendrobium thyrsiflorum TaxID=117978 RepID=A0ABD0VH47_DENTH
MISSSRVIMVPSLLSQRRKLTQPNQRILIESHELVCSRVPCRLGAIGKYVGSDHNHNLVVSFRSKTIQSENLGHNRLSVASCRAVQILLRATAAPATAFRGWFVKEIEGRTLERSKVCTLGKFSPLQIISKTDSISSIMEKVRSAISKLLKQRMLQERSAAKRSRSSTARSSSGQWQDRMVEIANFSSGEGSVERRSERRRAAWVVTCSGAGAKWIGGGRRRGVFSRAGFLTWLRDARQ